MCTLYHHFPNSFAKVKNKHLSVKGHLTVTINNTSLDNPAIITSTNEQEHAEFSQSSWSSLMLTPQTNRLTNRLTSSLQFARK